MPKGPKGKRSPSLYSSPELLLAKPKRKVLNALERRAIKSATLQLFIKRYGHRAHAGHDPNDRSYSRDRVEAVRYMSLEKLEKLLRGGEQGWCQGPRCEWRPEDVIGAAVEAMRIATGEHDKKPDPLPVRLTPHSL